VKTKPSFLSLITAIVLATCPQAVNANPLTATVAEVTDGDTVILNQGGRSITTQLACIDSPDWVNGQAQTNAENSRNRLTQLISVGSSVQYYDLGTINSGRVLAVIFSGDRNVNLQMVAEGQAQLHGSFRQTCPNSADALAEAESNARSQQLGIWNY
jgi:endonuclease YncB( thermonuclease family)